MWFLIIILTVPPAGAYKVATINSYPTYQLCEVAQVLVEEGMKEAEPDDISYRIRCVSMTEEYPVGTPEEKKEYF